MATIFPSTHLSVCGPKHCSLFIRPIPPTFASTFIAWNIEMERDNSSVFGIYSGVLYSTIRPRPCWLLQMNFSIYRTPVALQLISEFSLVMCPIFHQRDALASLPACLSLSVPVWPVCLRALW